MTKLGIFGQRLIKDSVCFQLNEAVADVYPGSGGSGSPAAVRIQFEYDVLKGQINDLSLNPFNQQDASNSLAMLELTPGGDLIIRDLAYRHLKVLKKWFPQGVFFLCRLQSNVKVYERTGKHDHALNRVKLRDYRQRYQLTCLEKEGKAGRAGTVTGAFDCAFITRNRRGGAVTESQSQREKEKSGPRDSGIQSPGSV